MVWYSVNWQKTTRGNAISEGSKMLIKLNKPVNHISGAIYQNGVPIIPFFSKTNSVSVLVKTKRDISGPAVLKIRGYYKDLKGFGVDDSFIIL